MPVPSERITPGMALEVNCSAIQSSVSLMEGCLCLRRSWIFLHFRKLCMEEFDYLAGEAIAADAAAEEEVAEEASAEDDVSKISVMSRRIKQPSSI